MNENTLTESQAIDIVRWKEKGASFRRVAEYFDDKYGGGFIGQENGVTLTQEALKLLGIDPVECWDI